jgi:hypothetical protein
LYWLLDNIDANCLRWHETGSVKNFRTFVTDGRDYIGYGEITATAANSYVNAVASPPDAAGYAIGISEDNAFYRGITYINGRQQFLTTNNGRIAGGTFAAQVFILLHGFRHVNTIPGFRSDANDLGAGIASNNVVDRECARTIRDAGRR